MPRECFVGWIGRAAEGLGHSSRTWSVFRRMRCPRSRSRGETSLKLFRQAMASYPVPFTFGTFPFFPQYPTALMPSHTGPAKEEAMPLARTCMKTLRNRRSARSTTWIMCCRLRRRICRRRPRRRRRRSGQRRVEGIRSWGGAVSWGVGFLGWS